MHALQLCMYVMYADVTSRCIRTLLHRSRVGLKNHEVFRVKGEWALSCDGNQADILISIR